MKSERLLKILLNLVQLDPSHKVQQMVCNDHSFIMIMLWLFLL